MVNRVVSWNVAQKVQPVAESLTRFLGPLAEAVPLMASGATVNGRALLLSHVGCYLGLLGNFATLIVA